MKQAIVCVFCFVIFGCKSELTVDISLSGSVDSDDGSIHCPDVCVREITDKETLTLTASTDAEDYAFHHWEGACTGTDPVCELELHPLLPFSVKAQFIYTGKALRDIEFEDPNLLACIQERVSDYSYRMPVLLSLDCSGRGIKSLAGMEELTSFHSYFILDNNQISDLSPLKGRRFFNGLYLRNNAIVDPTPLVEIPVYLGGLHLDGNPDIDCDAMQEVADNYMNRPALRVPQCDIPIVINP